MNEGPHLVQPAPRVERREVERLLGYRRGARPGPPIEERLAELLPLAASLAAPHGAWRLTGPEEARAVGLESPGDAAGLGLVTLGPALEEEAERRSSGGRLLDALLLDAYGSAAVEAAADEVNREICRAAAAAGLTARRRVSPGYGRWELAWQPELLARLAAEELGIRLTGGLMMVPRKTVSFAVPLARGGRPEPTRPACRTCPLAECAFRSGPPPEEAETP